MPAFIYIGVMFLAMGGAGAWYYDTTQTKIETLTQYNATLTANIEQVESVNKTNIDTIARMESNFKQQQEQFQNLQESFSKIRSQNNQLKDRLGKHDLGALASAKPALVEKILNGASKKAFRCFEIVSGATLTEKERSAKNGKAFNSECPWVWDDLVANGVLVDPSSTTSEDNN